VNAPLVELVDVSCDYRGLRPLRVRHLAVEAGDAVAILGFDAPAAEVFVNLVTGAILPDTGEVRLFGRPTSAITDSSDWLSTVDRLGIVTERAVLLEGMTVLQNLALPFTVDIDPVGEDVRATAEELGREVGLPADVFATPIHQTSGDLRARVRLGRALAGSPDLLVLEHASAVVPRDAVAQFGADLRAVAARRGSALVAATADDAFATAVGSRVVTLEAATGRLVPRRRRWW